MHAVEVGRLKEDLPARSGQLVAVCRDEAADLRSDQVRVLRQTHSNAYRHAFDALELTERQRRTVRQFQGNPIFQGVTKLDVDLVLLELRRVRDRNQRWGAPLRHERPRMRTQFANQLAGCTEGRHRASQ